MFGIGIPELILIALAVAILLFGSKHILNTARSFGRFFGEFKKSKREVEEEIRQAEESASSGAGKDKTGPSDPLV